MGYLQGINWRLNPQLKNWEPQTVVKLTTGMLITTNTDIYAYSETMFGVPTIGYVMTENWIYGCCHLGHTENEHKKTVSRIRFVTHINVKMRENSASNWVLIPIPQ